MIDVILYTRATKQRDDIIYYLWKNLPAGNAAEAAAAARIMNAEWAKLERVRDQLGACRG